MSDRRDQQLHFRVSKPELERIRNKMESSGILSIGSYLRKMALDGYCLHLDLPQLRRMAYLLQMCSNNLNQYAKVANENGRVYAADILNVPLEEFEEFKSHSLSVRTPSGRKTDLKQAPVRGLGTPNGGIVVFDKTSGEAMNIMPKSSAHVTLRCQDE